MIGGDKSNWHSLQFGFKLRNTVDHAFYDLLLLVVRPVSMEISWPCCQCIHILKTMQNSFIPIKLSLLP
jgi:hypothetical protein